MAEGAGPYKMATARNHVNVDLTAEGQCLCCSAYEDLGEKPRPVNSWLTTPMPNPVMVSRPFQASANATKPKLQLGSVIRVEGLLLDCNGM